MRASPIAAVALTFLVAGCFGAAPSALEPGPDILPPLSLSEIEARLSQPVFDAIERSEAVITSQTGTKIWMEVFRPADATGPVPVILVMTPYQHDLTDPTGVEPYSAGLVEYFAPRGYAVAFADTRGNNNSGGCIDQTGPKQWQEGYDTVEHLAAQTWSNGRVGTIGVSYDGETQISTALLNPPHLVTIVPIASVSNQYDYIYYEGVPYTLQGFGTMFGYMTGSLPPGSNPNAATTYPERFPCQPENFVEGVDPSGDWSPYWEERDYRNLAPGIQPSILQVHGLQDWNVKPNHIDPIWNSYTSEKRLILGQWGHANPDRPDWVQIRHRWFDHWLQGIDTGILADLPPVLVEDDAQGWRAVESFPPLGAETVTFYPAFADDGKGTLGMVAGGSDTRSIQDVPRDAVVVEGGPASGDAVVAGPVNDGRPVEFVFDTEPVSADLHYTGRPVLELVASLDQASTHFVAHLLEVEPDGTAHVTNRAYLDSRHRDGVDAPADVEPQEQYTFRLRFFPQDDVVEQGNRLRLVITNDDDWIQQDYTNAATAIRFGADATRLILPIAPLGSPVPEDALRPELKG